MSMTATLTIEEVYERELKQRSQQDRLRLLALLARDLAAGVAGEQPKRERNILELEGLGPITRSGWTPRNMSTSCGKNGTIAHEC
ncbi:MAG: hypothetical protein ACTHMJ_23805 [Thermomicrobiales bacterium]